MFETRLRKRMRRRERKRVGYVLEIFVCYSEEVD